MSRGLGHGFQPRNRAARSRVSDTAPTLACAAPLRKGVRHHFEVRNVRGLQPGVRHRGNAAARSRVSDTARTLACAAPPEKVSDTISRCGTSAACSACQTPRERGRPKPGVRHRADTRMRRASRKGVRHHFEVRNVRGLQPGVRHRPAHRVSTPENEKGRLSPALSVTPLTVPSTPRAARPAPRRPRSPRAARAARP